jgi:Zn-dependent protease with chaperone function
MLSRAGVRVTQILHWETQGQVANAAISGLLPGLRYLFVTDELLERLDLEQLRAITAHEAAHCRHGHLSQLAVSLTIPLLALLSVNPLLTAVAGSESAVRDSAAAPLLTLAVLGLWSVWHGRWSRLLEHHADLAACRLVAEPDQAISADVVASYGQALRATGGDADGDWLHPAPTTRIAFLERLAREPAAERDFERRLRATTRWQWLLIGLLVATWVGCS